jgi:hypothetical protein
MGRKPNVARFPGTGSGAPEVQVMRYTTGQTFIEYALVVLTAAGEVSECAADPTSLLGLSLGGAGKGPGYDMPNAGSTTQFTGRAQEVPVAIFNRNTVLSIRGINGATDPVTPLQTNIDEQYGVAKTAGGDWVLDLAETTAKVFEVVDIDTDLNIFLVKPIDGSVGGTSVIQRP